MHALKFNDTPLDVVAKDFKKAESRAEKLKDKYDGAVECVDKVKDYKENIEDKIEEYKDKVNDYVRQNQQRLDGYHRKYNQFGTRHSIEDEIWEETLTDFDHDDDEISHKSKIAEEDWADRIASAIWLSKGMNAVRAGTALMQNLQALLNYNAEDGGPRCRTAGQQFAVGAASDRLWAGEAVPRPQALKGHQLAPSRRGWLVPPPGVSDC